LKIGVPKEYFGDGLDAEVRTAVEAGITHLSEAVARSSYLHAAHGIRYSRILRDCHSGSIGDLARFDGVRYGYRSAKARTLADVYRKSRDEGFGAEVKRRIMLGTYALSSGYYDAYYLKAQKVRTLLTAI